MKLPNKKNFVLIILIFSFLIITVFSIIFLIKKNNNTEDSLYWENYQDFYQFKTDSELSDSNMFSVKGYVVLLEILEENSEQLVNLGIIVYNEDILENEVLPLKIAINKTNLRKDNQLNLERGDNILLTFKKNDEGIYIDFSSIDLLENEKEYLWYLFSHLQDSYIQFSKKKSYDPIITFSIEELSKEIEIFSEEEISEMNTYLTNVKENEIDLEDSFAPCFISKVKGMSYEPNGQILEEDLTEYESLRKPLDLVNSLFIESLEDPNIHKLLVENYFRKLADEIKYCNLSYDRSLEQLNNLLTYTARYKNINRETIKWIAEIVKELEGYGYKEAKFADFQIYFDEENYFNIEEDKLFRECILNKCDKEDILIKVSMYLKNKDGEKTFNNGENDIDLAISLTLLSILYND